MWFEVSKEGLSKLLERRGKSFVLAELLQNAWDAKGVSKVDLSLAPVEGRPLADLLITDDSPGGFSDLSHAFTLFAESEKKGDPSLRGRYNFGEKLVLALCESAEVASTTGTVAFDREGRHEYPRRTLPRGTRFSARIRMTRAEVADCLEAASSFIPPNGIETTVNGQRLVARKVLRTFKCSLPTEVAQADGIVRRSARNTSVDILQPRPGMPGRIYELGIPIVETGDLFDVDVGQKVPLSMERDSVSPSYLRAVRTAVLNNASDILLPAEASGAWIDDALEDKNATPKAVADVLRSRFGEKVATFDPSDREANDRATSLGYTVLQGGTFSKEAWANVRATGFAPPAGQVTPTPKPFDPNGDPAEHVDETEGMARFKGFCQALANEIMGVDISVAFLKRFNASAAYGGQRLTFNVSDLGKKWFEGPLRPEQLDLVLHEFGHEYEANHLSRGFSDALTRLGAKATFAAIANPRLFDLDTFEPAIAYGR